MGPAVLGEPALLLVRLGEELPHLPLQVHIAPGQPARQEMELSIGLRMPEIGGRVRPFWHQNNASSWSGGVIGETDASSLNVDVSS